MRLGVGLLALVPALVTAALARSGEIRPPAGLRLGIESLEARLDQAVARVSVPHAAMLIGRSETTRGYRLPGYGVLFVLAPRALPAGHGVFVLRRGPGVAGPTHPPVPPGHSGEDPWSRVSDDNAWEPERVEEIERQVLVLQHVAEAERRAAEEDMERIVHDVRVRLASPGAAPPAHEEGADATAPPASPPAVAPSSPGDLQLPATPPWKFWFESDAATEPRAPDQVVSDVKAAVIATLESEAGRVGDLRADEYVTVAVDFVPGGVFASHPRPQRTLVVRVRQRDLDARARGAIGKDDLEKKVEVFEY